MKDRSAEIGIGGVILVNAAMRAARAGAALSENTAENQRRIDEAARLQRDNAVVVDAETVLDEEDLDWWANADFGDEDEGVLPDGPERQGGGGPEPTGATMRLIENIPVDVMGELFGAQPQAIVDTGDLRESDGDLWVWAVQLEGKEREIQKKVGAKVTSKIVLRNVPEVGGVFGAWFWELTEDTEVNGVKAGAGSVVLLAGEQEQAVVLPSNNGKLVHPVITEVEGQMAGAVVFVSLEPDGNGGVRYDQTYASDGNGGMKVVGYEAAAFHPALREQMDEALDNLNNGGDGGDGFVMVKFEGGSAGPEPEPEVPDVYAYVQGDQGVEGGVVLHETPDMQSEPTATPVYPSKENPRKVVGRSADGKYYLIQVINKKGEVIGEGWVSARNLQFTPETFYNQYDLPMYDKDGNPVDEESLIPWKNETTEITEPLARLDEKGEFGVSTREVQVDNSRRQQTRGIFRGVVGTIQVGDNELYVFENYVPTEGRSYYFSVDPDALYGFGPNFDQLSIEGFEALMAAVEPGDEIIVEHYLSRDPYNLDLGALPENRVATVEMYSDWLWGDSENYSFQNQAAPPVLSLITPR